MTKLIIVNCQSENPKMAIPLYPLPTGISPSTTRLMPGKTVVRTASTEEEAF
ncbi:hypothetical protein GDO78_022222 [Eleutherodactylus coqui]|uniref:Uncharacterized protein n=1 Tax=Eleutherodactylus coqui TaxID=57060 RepID=A0A8J6JS47_ELECQ|nr:hypothetical protein GDO78_022222 [Eleutherodactylus coqui]